MFDLCSGSRKLDIGFAKRRVNVCLAARYDRADCLRDGTPIRDGLEFDRPIKVVVERNNTEIVCVLEQRERRLCGLLCHFNFLAAHASGLIEHHYHCDGIRFLLLRLKCHRQDFFDYRLRIAAFTVIVFSSGQNESAPQIANVCGQTPHLFFVQAVSRNIAEHQRVVCVQLFDGSRNHARRHSIYVKALVGKSGLQVFGALRMAFDI